MALGDYVPDWLRSREDRTEQRVEQFQKLVESAQNAVRKAGGAGAADAFAERMETSAVKAGGGTPLRPSVEPADRLSDWEIADRLARTNLTPKAVEAMVKDVATATKETTMAVRPTPAFIADAEAKQAAYAEQRRAWTDSVRAFAESYRERTIAQAPTAAVGQAQEQRETQRRGMRM